MNKGLLIVLTGPSGVGKHTLWEPLLEDKKLNLRYSISMTTRGKRVGEKHGREYFFVTHQEFKNAITNNEILEYAEYVGNHYGTPKKHVESLRDNGYNVLLEIEAQGGLNIIKYVKKNQDKRFLSIFVLPPSLDDLLNRLKNRGTESKAKINQRIKRAKWEVDQAKKYMYQIVNDDLQKARNELKSIILNKIKENAE